MKLLIITSVFPNENDVARGSFVNNFFLEQKEKCEVTVIAPQKIRTWKDLFIKNTKNIYRPKYLSLSNKSILSINLNKISNYFFSRAVNRCIKSNKIQYDTVYSHFLFPSGAASLKLKSDSKKYVMIGESSFQSYIDDYQIDTVKNIVSNFDGVACVSNNNRKQLISTFGLENVKVDVFPNAPDLRKFNFDVSNLNNIKFSIEENTKYLIFLGAFIERKGFNYFLDAARKLSNTFKIKLILIGKGKVPAEYADLIAFSGVVPNEHVSQYLNIADVFVLPTLSEGYCNAINEAMASKTPIVSSNIEDLDEQLGENLYCSIRVNPKSSDEIASAISELLENDELSSSFKERAYIKVSAYTFVNRVNNLDNWLKS